MKFSQLQVGQKFVHSASGIPTLYEKKSQSSAWLLDSDTLQHMFSTKPFHSVGSQSFCGFTGACTVHPLA